MLLPTVFGQFETSQVVAMESPFLAYFLCMMPSSRSCSKEVVVARLTDMAKFLISQGVEKEKVLSADVIKDRVADATLKILGGGGASPDMSASTLSMKLWCALKDMCLSLVCAKRLHTCVCVCAMPGCRDPDHA